MNIQIKQRAIDYFATMLKEDDAGIRIRLIPDGCAGWTHKISVCHEPKLGELMLKLDDDVTLITDQSTAAFINGLKIDYVSNDGINGNIVFNNPNLVACGCGKSFAKKNSNT